MKLFEFALSDEDLKTGFYDPAGDKSRRELDDTRKPKLTLIQVNRLKKMRALKTLENLKREDILAVMYSGGGDGGGGFGGGMF